MRLRAVVVFLGVWLGVLENVVGFSKIEDAAPMAMTSYPAYSLTYDELGERLHGLREMGAAVDATTPDQFRDRMKLLSQVLGRIITVQVAKTGNQLDAIVPTGTIDVPVFSEYTGNVGKSLVHEYFNVAAVPDANAPGAAANIAAGGGFRIYGAKNLGSGVYEISVQPFRSEDIGNHGGAVTIPDAALLMFGNTLGAQIAARIGRDGSFVTSLETFVNAEQNSVEDMRRAVFMDGDPGRGDGLGELGVSLCRMTGANYVATRDALSGGEVPALGQLQGTGSISWYHPSSAADIGMHISMRVGAAAGNGAQNCQGAGDQNAGGGSLVFRLSTFVDPFPLVEFMYKINRDLFTAERTTLALYTDLDDQEASEAYMEDNPWLMNILGRVAGGLPGGAPTLGDKKACFISAVGNSISTVVSLTALISTGITGAFRDPKNMYLPTAIGAAGVNIGMGITSIGLTGDAAPGFDLTALASSGYQLSDVSSKGDLTIKAYEAVALPGERFPASDRILNGAYYSLTAAPLAGGPLGDQYERGRAALFKKVLNLAARFVPAVDGKTGELGVSGVFSGYYGKVQVSFIDTGTLDAALGPVVNGGKVAFGLKVEPVTGYEPTPYLAADLAWAWTSAPEKGAATFMNSFWLDPLYLRVHHQLTTFLVQAGMRSQPIEGEVVYGTNALNNALAAPTNADMPVGSFIVKSEGNALTVKRGAQEDLNKLKANSASQSSTVLTLTQSFSEFGGQRSGFSVGAAAVPFLGDSLQMYWTGANRGLNVETQNPNGITISRARGRIVKDGPIRNIEGATIGKAPTAGISITIEDDWIVDEYWSTAVALQNKFQEGKAGGPATARVLPTGTIMIWSVFQSGAYREALELMVKMFTTGMTATVKEPGTYTWPIVTGAKGADGAYTGDTFSGLTGDLNKDTQTGGVKVDVVDGLNEEGQYEMTFATYAEKTGENTTPFKNTWFKEVTNAVGTTKVKGFYKLMVAGSKKNEVAYPASTDGVVELGTEGRAAFNGLPAVDMTMKERSLFTDGKATINLGGRKVTVTPTINDKLHAFVGAAGLQKNVLPKKAEAVPPGIDLFSSFQNLDVLQQFVTYKASLAQAVSVYYQATKSSFLLVECLGIPTCTLTAGAGFELTVSTTNVKSVYRTAMPTDWSKSKVQNGGDLAEEPTDKSLTPKNSIFKESMGYDGRLTYINLYDTVTYNGAEENVSLKSNETAQRVINAFGEQMGALPAAAGNPVTFRYLDDDIKVTMKKNELSYELTGGGRPRAAASYQAAGSMRVDYAVFKAKNPKSTVDIAFLASSGSDAGELKSRTFMGTALKLLNLTIGPAALPYNDVQLTGSINYAAELYADAAYPNESVSPVYTVDLSSGVVALPSSTANVKMNKAAATSLWALRAGMKNLYEAALGDYFDKGEIEVFLKNASKYGLTTYQQVIAKVPTNPSSDLNDVNKDELLSNNYLNPWNISPAGSATLTFAENKMTVSVASEPSVVESYTKALASNVFTLLNSGVSEEVYTELDEQAEIMNRVPVTLWSLAGVAQQLPLFGPFLGTGKEFYLNVESIGQATPVALADTGLHITYEGVTDLTKPVTIKYENDIVDAAKKTDLEKQGTFVSNFLAPYPNKPGGDRAISEANIPVYVKDVFEELKQEDGQDYRKSMKLSGQPPIRFSVNAQKRDILSSTAPMAEDVSEGTVTLAYDNFTWKVTYQGIGFSDSYQLALAMNKKGAAEYPLAKPLGTYAKYLAYAAYQLLYYKDMPNTLYYGSKLIGKPLVLDEKFADLKASDGDTSITQTVQRTKESKTGAVGITDASFTFKKLEKDSAVAAAQVDNKSWRWAMSAMSDKVGEVVFNTARENTAASGLTTVTAAYLGEGKDVTVPDFVVPARALDAELEKPYRLAGKVSYTKSSTGGVLKVKEVYNNEPNKFYPFMFVHTNEIIGEALKKPRLADFANPQKGTKTQKVASIYLGGKSFVAAAFSKTYVVKLNKDRQRSSYGAKALLSEAQANYTDGTQVASLTKAAEASKSTTWSTFGLKVLTSDSKAQTVEKTKSEVFSAKTLGYTDKIPLELYNAVYESLNFALTNPVTADCSSEAGLIGDAGVTFGLLNKPAGLGFKSTTAPGGGFSITRPSSILVTAMVAGAVAFWL